MSTTPPITTPPPLSPSMNPNSSLLTQHFLHIAMHSTLRPGLPPTYRTRIQNRLIHTLEQISPLSGEAARQSVMYRAWRCGTCGAGETPGIFVARDRVVWELEVLARKRVVRELDEMMDKWVGVGGWRREVDVEVGRVREETIWVEEGRKSLKEDLEWVELDGEDRGIVEGGLEGVGVLRLFNL